MPCGAPLAKRRRRPASTKAGCGNRPQEAFFVAISYRFQHELPHISVLLLDGFVLPLRPHHLADIFLIRHCRDL